MANQEVGWSLRDSIRWVVTSEYDGSIVNSCFNLADGGVEFVVREQGSPQSLSQSIFDGWD
ncbi:hypothetical protein T05_8375 [Trichinella murrelli]|uniref:Uncharacterized protein n=1 Tax=Trichinella murrelli TaxID=144512 RepID=A0A0V0T6F8_9BILA|nr:hypothetical protein T05_8375 [Trichinella murrelli]